MLSRIDFENILKPEFPHIYKKIIKNSELKLKHHLDMKKKLLLNIHSLADKSGITLPLLKK